MADEEIMSYECKEYGRVHAKGLFRDHAKHQEFLTSVEKHCPKEATVPGKLNLADKVSLPENQGACGSCWDFSLTKAFRSAYMLAGKDPGRLAFNYLLNNCGPQAHPMYGCNGGDFIAGAVFLKAAPWLESQDPYRQQDGGRCMNLPAACEPALTFKAVGSGNQPPTFQELAQAMADGHMLSVDVAAAAGNWESYSGGIYNGRGNGIDHMINMVGYDMQTSVDAQGNALFNDKGMPVNGDGYLIVMNNWGESWGTQVNGHGGYMFTRWGCNQIAETAMYFEVKKPTPPPPPPPPPPVPVPPAPPVDWKLIAIAGVAAVGLVLGLIALLRK